MKVITLTAKEKICKCEETECNPVSCPILQKVILNRVNDAVYDLIMNYNEITRRRELKISLKNIWFVLLKCHWMFRYG